VERDRFFVDLLLLLIAGLWDLWIRFRPAEQPGRWQLLSRAVSRAVYWPPHRN
jgi:hypothetical protein